MQKKAGDPFLEVVKVQWLVSIKSRLTSVS
jgi:hypothetical protein